MGKVITPTVGRRVWFFNNREHREDFEAGLDGQQPYDAGVIYVHTTSLVNLLVTDHLGHQYAETSVVLQQPEEPIPDGRHAAWMPYQQAQANK